jgi:DNA-directed RNA polymerase specialized sigma24 family protein
LGGTLCKIGSPLLSFLLCSLCTPLQSAVNYALRQLSPKDRMLFYRKYYYLQSTAQIASELGMTERAVEGKLYRLKKQLRKMLGGEVHE